MFRIFAILALFLASTTPAVVAAEKTRLHADGLAISDESLIRHFELAVEDCRGDLAGEGMMLACVQRDAYLRLLDGRMLCENDNHDWYTCTSRRELEAGMDFGEDSDVVPIANDGLVKRWRIADAACRSSFKSSISTYIACADRDLYRQLLGGRKLCLTGGGWVAFKPK